MPFDLLPFYIYLPFAFPPRLCGEATRRGIIGLKGCESKAGSVTAALPLPSYLRGRFPSEKVNQGL
jgi:hypothetical protein